MGLHEGEQAFVIDNVTKQAEGSSLLLSKRTRSAKTGRAGRGAPMRANAVMVRHAPFETLAVTMDVPWKAARADGAGFHAILLPPRGRCASWTASSFCSGLARRQRHIAGRSH